MSKAQVIIADFNGTGVVTAKPSVKWFVPNSVTQTNKFQAGLPRLPVADLSSTIVKYLKSIRPLLNDDDFKRACVVAFESATSAQGRELQERLIERAKSKPDSSWLIDWWNDWCYLTDREPLVFFVSYFYAFKDLTAYVPKPSGASFQSSVAAALVHHAISFRSEILSGTLLPDKSAGKPQCMAQYGYIFNACRVPGPKADHYVTYEPHSNTHIVVLCRGHIYSVNVIGDDAKSIGTAALQAAFDAILSDAKSIGDCSLPIGVLTSDLRDRWAEARGQLLGASGGVDAKFSGLSSNKAGLETIQSAILAVCLDKEEFSSAGDEGASERARAFWHGDGRNRFYVSIVLFLFVNFSLQLMMGLQDKTLQFIVLASGRCGFIGEHALADGSPTLRLCDYVLSRISSKGGRAPVDPLLPIAACPLAVSRLVWQIPQAVKAAIGAAAAAFDELVTQHGLAAVTVQGLGRDGIKALGVPTDAFCQLALQLAFFRIRGRPAATYEAASTRGFLHGRTETIRSCTVEAQALVAKMQDPTASDVDRRAALTAAAAQHQRLAREAGQGLGVDRHLLGLRMLRRDGEPELPLLADPAYRASCTWELSTSTLASEGFESWGFGEVVPHGFGVGYSALAGATSFVVTCRDAEGVSSAVGARARSMAAAIKASMEDLAAVCRRTPSAPAARSRL